MIKLLLPLVAILALSGFLIFKFSQNSSPKPAPSTSPLAASNQTLSPSPSASPSPSPSPSPLPTLPPTTNVDPALVKRINELTASLSNLETTTSDLKTRLAKLEKTPTQNPSAAPAPSAASTPTSRAPVFIPINSGGSINSSDWTSLTSGTVTINPSDFPGYTNMNLIITLNVYQGNGKAFARIANSSSGNAIIASETSTTSEKATQVISGSFNLPSGQATYAVQLKTLTVNYPSIASYSFIKVNY